MSGISPAMSGKCRLINIYYILIFYRLEIVWKIEQMNSEKNHFGKGNWIHLQCPTKFSSSCKQFNLGQIFNQKTEIKLRPGFLPSKLCLALYNFYILNKNTANCLSWLWFTNLIVPISIETLFSWIWNYSCQLKDIFSAGSATRSPRVVFGLKSCSIYQKFIFYIWFDFSPDYLLGLPQKSFCGCQLNTTNTSTRNAASSLFWWRFRHPFMNGWTMINILGLLNLESINQLSPLKTNRVFPVPLISHIST